MARLRRRKNPLKPLGALLINPRKRRARKGKRNPKVGTPGFGVRVGAYARRKASKPGRRRKVVSARSLSKRPRRRARKNPSTGGGLRRVFSAGFRKRVKARASKSGRSFRQVARHRVRSRAKRNPLFLARRRNPLFIARKRNPARRRRARKSYGGLFSMKRNPASGLGKIPVIGPILASALGFVPHAAFGAVSVEPVMALTQMAAPYLPAWMPFSATVALGGLLLGATIKAFGPKIVSAATADKLAVATAAGAGAIAYWTWRTGEDASAAEKVGSLMVAGYGNPLAIAVMGDANLGSLISAGQGRFAGYGDFGPAAVTPMYANLPGASRHF